MQQQPTLPSFAFAGLLLPLAAVAWRWPRAGLPLVFFIAGAMWVTLRAGWLLQEQLPTALEGQDLRVVGRIADIPVAGERNLRFAFDVERAWHNDQPINLPRRLQLSFYNARQIGRAHV